MSDNKEYVAVLTHEWYGSPYTSQRLARNDRGT